MRLQAVIETIPPDNSGTHSVVSRDVEVEADDFEACMAAARASLVGGERLVWVRTL